MKTQTRIFPRHSKGKRPSFFDDPAIDQMMTFIVELTTEVSVLRDRLNTMEHVLEESGAMSREAIESFRPGESLEEERMEQRKAFLERVFRMHSQDAPGDK